jgi:exosortase F-associated protein
MPSNTLRILLGIVASAGLLTFFLLQRIDFASMLYAIENPTYRFLANRFFRFLLNDTLAILLIYALFTERKYVVFALWVQLFGFVFLLLPYFMLKIYWPAYNGPMINFLHRIILNPTLIMLLIPAFYYQRSLTK